MWNNSCVMRRIGSIYTIITSNNGNILCSRLEMVPRSIYQSQVVGARHPFNFLSYRMILEHVLYTGQV